jgi:integrase
VARISDARPLFVALDPAVGRRRASIAVQPIVSRLSRSATNALIGRLGRRAGLARLTPHMLRHTAITAVLDAGASIREAQRFSRHKDPRVLLPGTAPHRADTPTRVRHAAASAHS